MSNDAQPPRMLPAPLKLTAMTLRGLGPYLHGARLEIKPLTILCGENGSGKSTWIETLSKLKVTAAMESFPFDYLHDPSGTEETTYSRSDLHAAMFFPPHDDSDNPNERQENLRRKRQELCGSDAKNHGPPSCIGLEIEATQGQDFPVYVPELEHPLSAAQEFLWCGKLSAGSRLEIRWAYPVLSFRNERQRTAGLHQWIELVLVMSNKRYTLRLDRPLDEIFAEGQWTRVEPHFRLSCSKAYLFGNGAEETDHEQIGKVSAERGNTNPQIEEGIALAKPLCDNFRTLFREIINQALSGFFPISAIREIHREERSKRLPDKRSEDDEEQEQPTAEAAETSEEVELLRRLQELVGQVSTLTELRDQLEKNDDILPYLLPSIKKIDSTLRYVGNRGEDSQELLAYWAYNLMRQPVPPYTGAIDNDFVEDDFLAGWEDGETSNRFPIHRRLHELKNNKDLLEVADPIIRVEWEAAIENEVSTNAASIKLLNNLLTKPELYKRGLPYWPNISEEAQVLIDQGVSSRLTPDEYVRLNRLLLEGLFSRNRSPSFQGVYCKDRPGYLLETFVSYWLKYFTDTQQMYGTFHDSPLDKSWNDNELPSESKKVPNGWLVHDAKKWMKRGSEVSNDFTQMIRPPTMPGWAAWHVMSTGFHQLAPIVVQAGLLRQNEIMAVENPEAHLHPSLQIKVAKFLMHQANAGKIMLIETHSDLIVRRILRAIREEDVGHIAKGQAGVAIHFTKLVKDEKGGFQHATIKQYETNSHGQIVWPDGFPPPGFMTDSLDEARRFIDNEMDDLSDEGDDDE